jgi:hypothetical protein
MSFTGTAAELDELLPDSIVSFIAGHLELKNTLARAKEEMDAAAKAAQAEARNKAKNNKRPSSESAGKVDPAAKEEQNKEPGPRRSPGLFDHPAAPQLTPEPKMAAPVAAAATLGLQRRLHPPSLLMKRTRFWQKLRKRSQKLARKTTWQPGRWSLRGKVTQARSMTDLHALKGDSNDT